MGPKKDVALTTEPMRGVCSSSRASKNLIAFIVSEKHEVIFMAAISQKDIDRIIEKFKYNNINAFYFSEPEEAFSKIEELIQEGATVGLGGSVTLTSSGILERLRAMNIVLYDRYKEGLSWEEVSLLRDKSLTADVFLSSTNALSKDGALINADGIGNRTASHIYGPKKVIILAGTNKIVENVEEGLERIRTIAAPKNAQRLGIGSPCAESEECVGEDCFSSKKRLCNKYVIIKGEWTPERFYVFIVDRDWGL